MTGEKRLVDRQLGRDRRPNFVYPETFVVPNHSGVRPVERVSVVWHAFGGFEDKPTTIIMPMADTYTKVTNVTGDLFEGMEADGITLVDDEMVFQYDGDYSGTFSITISGLNGKDYHIRVYNITQSKVMGYPLSISTTGAGNKMLLAMPLYLEVNKDDVLRLEMKSADGSSATLADCVFYIAYLHE